MAGRRTTRTMAPQQCAVPTSAPDTGAPRSRRIYLPRLAVRASALVWVVLITAETVAGPECTAAQPCRAPVDTLAFYLQGFQITALAVPVLLLLAPVGAMWFGAVTAALVATTGAHPGWWFALATLCGAMATLDQWGRRRQGLGSRTLQPDPRAVALAQWRHDRRPGLLISVVPPALALAGCLGLLAGLASSVDSQRSFEQGSVVSTARIVRVDEGGAPFLEVNGRVSGVSEDGGQVDTYTVGQVVAVRTNSRDPGRVELVAEPNDPTWRLGIAGILAGAAFWWWAIPGRDRRLSARSLVKPGAVVPARVVAVREGLLVVEGPWPWAVLKPLEDEVPDAAAADQGRSVPELSPEELSEWGEKKLIRPFVVGCAWRPGSEGPEEVDVLGPWLQDSEVVVTKGERRMIARLRDPWTFRNLVDPRRRPRLWSARPTGRPPGIARVEPLEDLGIVRPSPWHLLSWRFGPSLRWVVTPLVGALAGATTAFLIAAFVPSPGLAQLVYATFGIVIPLWILAGLGAGRVMPHARGLVLLGGVIDEVWGSGRVSEVIPGRHSLVLRLRDPQDAVPIHRLAVTGTGDGDAERLVNLWLRSATDPARVGPGARWRLGPLVPSLLLAVATFLACQVIWPMA